MSRRQISDREYARLRELDEHRGVEQTPARMRYLRAQADLYADDQCADDQEDDDAL